jgi:hypothetical protein
MTTQHLGPDHKAMTPEALDQLRAYHERSGTHMWQAMLCHTISTEALGKMGDTPPLFDGETLIFAAIGCFICETPYKRELRLLRCPGEPPNGARNQP